MLDSWQITGVQDREMTDDSLRDWEEKVAENVKHADGYRCALEWISDQRSLLAVWSQKLSINKPLKCLFCKFLARNMQTDWEWTAVPAIKLSK